MYVVVFLDAIYYKVRTDGKVQSRVAYSCLGIHLDGKVDVLGLWLAESEGAHFWLSVLTDLKERGVADILIDCVDGLKGFPEAIQTIFPKTQVQLCVVHQIRAGNFAYATDFKKFPSDAIAAWKGRVHTMVASGIRYREHASHSSVKETVELFEMLEVKRGFIHHLAQRCGC